MKPVSRVNPATEENQGQDRNSTNMDSSSRDSSRNSGKQSSESRGESRGEGSREMRREKSGEESGSGFSTEAIGTAFNSFAGKASEVASNVMDKAQEYGTGAVEQSGTFIRRYPTQTLLAGFGIGLVLGLGLGRR
jgi:ElaB/YqjD/DUF883 family membrane-anchored ribosome-binding protein